MLPRILIGCLSLICCLNAYASIPSQANPRHPHYVRTVYVEQRLNNHPDPYENFNRVAFYFNETADKFILKPLANIYNLVVPYPISRGVSNFFTNLMEPAVVVNDVLQCEGQEAIADTCRFGINTTIGLLGVIDVAKHMGLSHNHQDMGLTFARWGYRHSAYFVIPFFGPSTIRDTLGMPLDFLLSAWPYIKPSRLAEGLYVLDIIDTRAELLKSDKLISQVAVDDYVFMRDAYLQYRNRLIDPERHDEPDEDELALAHMGF